VGDLISRRVAQLLRDQARSDDLHSRFGGDEFCFLIPGLRELRRRSGRRAFEAISRRLDARGPSPRGAAGQNRRRRRGLPSRIRGGTAVHRETTRVRFDRARRQTHVPGQERSRERHATRVCAHSKGRARVDGRS
jgi:GGDEF domain-containing protein